MACLALLGAQSPLPVLADAQPGREVFAQHCSQCHRAGPASLRTPAARIPALLRSGSVRPHRFHLTDTQLRDLDAYLTEVKADGR